jgi:hypothetical protein
MKQNKTIDRDQAAIIEQHLLDAESALNRACEAILRLGGEARSTFGIPLSEAASDLRFVLLKVIYDRFPDLKPPPEIPTVSSTLAWADVCLPPSITEADVDGVIFSVLKPQWRKTAAIVGTAYKRCEELGWPIDDEALAARIEVLADDDRIEYQGYLRYWGNSEVRLKP